MPAFPFCTLRLTAPKPPVPPYPRRLRTPGDHLRKRRLDLGLKQADIASLVGAKRQTVWGWENKGHVPAAEFRSGVADFLGYAPAVLDPAEAIARLTAFRRALRLPRSLLADLLGVSYEAVWAWETGRRRPRGRTLDLIGQFLAPQVEDDKK